MNFVLSINDTSASYFCHMIFEVCAWIHLESESY